MTKNNKLSAIVIIIILLIGGVWYYSTRNVSPSVSDNTNNTNTTPPDNSGSIKGCYVAKLAKDVYTLDIESENNGAVSGILAFNNYQKDSSSGSFDGQLTGDILQGNYSFDSEGMHSDRQVIFKKVGDNFVEGFGPASVVNGKEVFSDPSKLTYDPKSTFVKTANCLEHFTDSSNTFSFDYNALFAAFEGDKTPSTQWRSNTTQNGVLLANVYAYRTYLPKTNFSESHFTVGRSNDAGAIKSCTTADPNSGEANKGSVNISGYPFTKFMVNDAGAGNLYETTSYRGIFDGDCYAIEYTIHSTNIGNYSPDQGIKEFDKAKIVSDMENIVKSFKFLISSN